MKNQVSNVSAGGEREHFHSYQWFSWGSRLDDRNVHAESFDLTIMSDAAKLYKNGYLCWFLCSIMLPDAVLKEKRRIVLHFSIYVISAAGLSRALRRKSNGIVQQSNFSSNARFGYRMFRVLSIRRCWAVTFGEINNWQSIEIVIYLKWLLE